MDDGIPPPFCRGLKLIKQKLNERTFYQIQYYGANCLRRQALFYMLRAYPVCGNDFIIVATK